MIVVLSSVGKKVHDLSRLRSSMIRRDSRTLRLRTGPTWRLLVFATQIRGNPCIESTGPLRLGLLFLGRRTHLWVLPPFFRWASQGWRAAAEGGFCCPFPGPIPGFPAGGHTGSYPI